MKNKKTILVTFIVILFLAVYTFLMDHTLTSSEILSKQDGKLELKNNSSASAQSPQPTTKVLIESIEVVNKPESTFLAQDEVKENGCISESELEKDPANQMLEEWMKQNLMMGDYENRLARYAYATEEKLLELAKSGEPEAMWTLGINYRWYAYHENFQSMFLKPTDQPMPKYVKRPLDIEILNKSRYWFEQAALNGLVSGFTEMLHTHDLELAYLAEQTDVSEEDILKIKLDKLVNYKLIETTSPEYFKLLSDFEFIEPFDNKLLEDNKPLFKSMLAEKLDNWERGREELGKAFSNFTEIPDDVIRLSQLTKNLCD